MLAISLLLALMMPLVAIASPFRLEDQPWKSANADRYHGEEHSRNATGDTLETTRCYCASKNWMHDNLFGYYYRFDYYNFHGDIRYLIERFCHRNGWTQTGILGSRDGELICLRVKLNGERECVEDLRKNKFCYYFYGKEKFDKFTFNHQRRGLPLDSPSAIHYSGGEVQEKCETLCHDKVGNGDMEMLRGRSEAYANVHAPVSDRYNFHDEEWSRISYYPEIDDMCNDCK